MKLFLNFVWMLATLMTLMFSMTHPNSIGFTLGCAAAFCFGYKWDYYR
jgi:hypothetical protein